MLTQEGGHTELGTEGMRDRKIGQKIMIVDRMCDTIVSRGGRACYCDMSGGNEFRGMRNEVWFGEG